MGTNRKQIEIRQMPGKKLNEPVVTRLLKVYLRLLGMPRASVSLLVCGDAESRRLNARFRKARKATDILSFPTLPGRPPRGFSGFLGDLALNPAYILRRFPRFCGSQGEEIAFLLLHGLLHLCGHHHDTRRQEEALWRLQERVFRAAKPYRYSSLFSQALP